MKRILTIFAAVAVAAVALYAASQEVLGAGATFPYPLYTKMFKVYSQEKSVKVNYQGIGSGGGIQQLISKTVDFGGTDAPMTSKEEKAAGAEVIHVPTCLGAVVLTYNLPGNPKLNFTPDVIADIFLGKITKWNDSRLAAINAGTTLPDMAIVVVRRSDGSGTTFTFSEYLAAVSPEWKTKVGVGKSLNWPVGLGGKGNPGVAAYVKQTPGAIGYVEVAFAKQNKMPWGKVQNKSGNFVDADLASVSAAANVTLPAHTKVSLVNTEAANGYPICTFTWVILYKEQGYGGRPLDRAKATVDLIWWMVHEGQQYNETLDYGRLPAAAVKASENLLKTVTHNGKPVRK